MRILIISKNFPPKIDGVGDYSYHLKKELSKDGSVEEIYVATSVNEAFKTNKYFFFFYNWSIREFIKLKGFICENAIDYILFQYVPYSFSRLGIPLLLPFKLNLLPVKCVTVFHEIAVGYELPNPKSWIIASLQRLIAWKIAYTSDAVITSTGLYEKLLKKFSKKIYRIGIGPNIIAEQQSLTTLKNNIVISSFSNRINRELLKAVKILIEEEGIDVRLVGLGYIPDNSRITLEKEIAHLGLDHAVSLMGILEENEFIQHLIDSNIYLQIEPVDKNNKGGVSLKSGALAVAMSCGLPIVITKGQMTDSDILRHKKEVYYTTNSAENITQSIEYLLKHPELLDRLGKGSFNYYKENMTWSTIASKYVSVLNSL